MTRKPILEGQPGALAPGAYVFVRWCGDGQAIFREGPGGAEEVFQARPHGVASWHLFWRNTFWEFTRRAP